MSNQDVKLTEVKAIDGVNASPLTTVKCQNERRPTMIGDALLKRTTTMSSYENQIACVLTKCSSITSLSRQREQDARERIIG